jgi:LPXTG-motif cell wall-anchored protein
VAVSSVPKPAAKFVSAPRGGATLPQTATDAELRLWLGFGLCGSGLVLLLIWRRRRPAACGLEPRWRAKRAASAATL